MLAAEHKNSFTFGSAGGYAMETSALPFSMYLEALQHCPYASTERVMLQFLGLTGCRLSELAHARVVQGWAVIRLGKNQRGYRREPLPAGYLEELAEYRRRHRIRESRLFGVDGRTLRRYFNGRIRPLLSDRWRERDTFPRNTGYVRHKPFLYELKGIRKSFCSTIFWREWKRWGSPDTALLFACQRLKHSAKEITAIHYLKELGTLEASRWDDYLRFEAEPVIQHRITDY